MKESPSIPDARSLDRGTQQAIRMRTVAAVRSDTPPEEAASSAGVHVRTVFKWLVAFNSGGQNALVETKALGAKPKLNAMQMMRLSRILRSDSPQLQHRFEFALWTLTMITALIQTQFGVHYSKTGVHKLMHSLGFTPQRPLYRAWQADPVLVECWQAQELPALRKLAKKRNALIYFADEAGIRSESHFGRTWGLEGRTPVVKATGQRFGLNAISAISPRGKCASCYSSASSRRRCSSNSSNGSWSDRPAPSTWCSIAIRCI